MDKFAYKAPQFLRPNRYPNLREAANQPWMGVTAFIQEKPFLVVGFNAGTYILEGENEDFFTTSDPFEWKQATENSSLVAASRVEDSPIPRLPLAYVDNDWVLKAGEGEFPLEDVVASVEAFGWSKAAFQFDELEFPTKGPEYDYEPHGEPENNSYSTLGKLNCPYCEHAMVKPSFVEKHPYRCDNCGEVFGEKESHEVGDKDFELGDPPRCPHCGGHTLKLVDRTAGKFYCHTCGKESVQDIVAESKVAYETDKGEGKGNYAPYAPGPGDPKKAPKCNCGYSWKDYHSFQLDKLRCPECGKSYHIDKKKSSFQDDRGNDLQSGKSYLMHSPKYKVPDLVKILNIESNTIEAALEGNDEYPVKIDEETYRDMMYSFEPFIAADNTSGPTPIEPNRLEQIREAWKNASAQFETDPSPQNYSALLKAVNQLQIVFNNSRLAWDYNDTTNSMGGRDTLAPIRENPLDYDENVINQSETASPPNTPPMGMPQHDENLGLFTPRGTVHKMTSNDGTTILVMSNGKGGIMGWSPFNGEQSLETVNWDTSNLYKLEQAISGGQYQVISNYKYIKKRGDKWVIIQKGTGKVLSEHDSEEKAQASFRAMMMHKHQGAISEEEYLLEDNFDEDPYSSEPRDKNYDQDYDEIGLLEDQFRMAEESGDLELAKDLAYRIQVLRDTVNTEWENFDDPEAFEEEEEFDEFDSKVARKAFTPSQQKELIDENPNGKARNISKLNISNSHYERRSVVDNEHLWLW